MKPTHQTDRYTLYHGDCLDVLPTLEAGSVDAVICDPPYGTTACSWDSVIPFAPMWGAIKHVIKPRAAVVLFGSQPFTSALVMSNPSWFKYEWVWDKVATTGFQSCSIMPLKQHENVLVFGRSGVVYTPQMSEGEPYKRPQTSGGAYMGKETAKKLSGWITLNDGFRYPTSIIEFSNADQTNKLHPTQKPVALMEYLIRTYTNEGDTVLDFTMGSGTTGAAAMRTGRKFIGVELDADYYDIAHQRIANAAGDFCPAPRDNERQMALFW